MSCDVINPTAAPSSYGGGRNALDNYLGGPSSKVDEFLAALSQFDIVHGVDFSTPTSCQSATLVRPIFAFYCTLVFTRKKS